MVIILFQDGMGNLQLNQEGIRLEGVSEFILPLYVNEIQSRKVSLLPFVSSTTSTLEWDDYCFSFSFQASVWLVLISQYRGGYNKNKLPSDL